jgi:hypothetical protein
MEPHIANQMARLVLGDAWVNPHSNAVERADDIIAASRAHNNQDHIKRSDATLKKAAKDGSKKKDCTIMSVHKITYGDELKKLFENMTTLNIDEKKDLDQQIYKTFNHNPIIDLFDFSPSSFDVNQKYNETISEDITNNDFSSMLLGAFLSLTSIEISHHS